MKNKKKGGAAPAVSPLIVHEMEETGIGKQSDESDTSLSTDAPDTASVMSTVNWDEVAKGLKKKTQKT
jgi:hypothetical protein